MFEDFDTVDLYETRDARRLERRGKELRLQRHDEAVPADHEMEEGLRPVLGEFRFLPERLVGHPSADAEHVGVKAVSTHGELPTHRLDALAGHEIEELLRPLSVEFLVRAKLFATCDLRFLREFGLFLEVRCVLGLAAAISCTCRPGLRPRVRSCGGCHLAHEQRICLRLLEMHLIRTLCESSGEEATV